MVNVLHVPHLQNVMDTEKVVRWTYMQTPPKSNQVKLQVSHTNQGGFQAVTDISDFFIGQIRHDKCCTNTINTATMTIYWAN